jgi:hypothetical protein
MGFDQAEITAINSNTNKTMRFIFFTSFEVSKKTEIPLAEITAKHYKELNNL